MGFKFSYSSIDLANVVRIINTVMHDSCNSRNDGYIGFGAKQDLYGLKSILDNALKRCPDFGEPEKEWLKEQEQKQVIKILKDEM
jgi:hypothetical protein